MPAKKRAHKMTRATKRRVAKGNSRMRSISLLALFLLIALFVARRIGIRFDRGYHEASVAPYNGTEQLSPQDRARLDQLIRDKSKP
jgi:hypothetical protein